MFAAEADEVSFSPDMRSARRRKVFKAARITVDGGRTYTTCTLKEISDFGAKLQIVQGQVIPSVFDLVVEMDGMRARCDVMRRDGDEIGVRFCSAPTMGQPLRRQVIVPSTMQPASSLRRRPVVN